MKYRWSIAPAQPALAAELARQFGVSALLAQCLLNRGHSEPEAVKVEFEPVAHKGNAYSALAKEADVRGDIEKMWDISYTPTVSSAADVLYKR